MNTQAIRMRLLLAACTLAAPATWSGCGPSMPENQYASIQKANEEAEAAIRSMGKIDRKSYGALGSAWSVKLPKATFDEKLIEHLTRLDRISEFHVPGAIISDEQMQHILTSSIGVFFNDVNVSDTGLSDAGVQALPNCKWLQKVNIKGTKISDSFLTEMRTKRRSNIEVPAQCKNVAVTK